MRLNHLADLDSSSANFWLAQCHGVREWHLLALLNVNRALNFALNDFRNPDVLGDDSVADGNWCTASTRSTGIAATGEVAARTAAVGGNAT